MNIVNKNIVNKNIVVGFVCISIASTAFVFALGSKDRKFSEEATFSRMEAQARWIKMLDKNNPELHDAVIAAMLVSKDSGKEVFVLRENAPNKKLKYKLSVLRGNEDNILSYTHKDSWFAFDHYNDNDGPWLSTAENQLFIENKLNKYYKELNIK